LLLRFRGRGRGEGLGVKGSLYLPYRGTQKYLVWRGSRSSVRQKTCAVIPQYLRGVEGLECNEYSGMERKKKLWPTRQGFIERLVRKAGPLRVENRQREVVGKALILNYIEMKGNLKLGGSVGKEIRWVLKYN